jgi:hypothetical protein
MTTDNASLFIDANKYLDLYRTKTGKLILAALGEQADHIFVTQQIVNEVKRNKIKVAADFLTKEFTKLKLQTFKMPDHLFGETEEQSGIILGKMKKIQRDIEQLNKEVDAFAAGIMRKVSQSTDEVSMALAPIFAKAVPHSKAQLQRAKERKECGNPPGKRGDPIGDELTWEQLLSGFVDKKKLWIITRDSDYGSTYGGKGFFNQLLYEELVRVSPSAEVFVFEHIPDGIKHFADTTGVKADKLPSLEKIEEIKKEEETLTPWFGTIGDFVTAYDRGELGEAYRRRRQRGGWLAHEAMQGVAPGETPLALRVAGDKPAPESDDASQDVIPT